MIHIKKKAYCGIPNTVAVVDNGAIISNISSMTTDCSVPLVDLALIARNSPSPTLANGDVILAAGISPLVGGNKYWRVNPNWEGNIYSCLVDNSGVISTISICL